MDPYLLTEWRYRSTTLWPGSGQRQDEQHACVRVTGPGETPLARSHLATTTQDRHVKQPETRWLNTSPGRRRGRECGSMRTTPLLRKVDAVTVPVPDLDSGLRFYCDALGHLPLWRNESIGQAGLSLPDSDTEIVLTTGLGYAPNWLVDSADEAAAAIRAAGGEIITEPFNLPVGRIVVVSDAFGNVLVLVDLSKGLYATNDSGEVTGVAETPDTPGP